MVISSPSKSALKGLQDPGLKRNVEMPGNSSTSASNPMMEVLDSVGCRLNRTRSPVRSMRCTMQPSHSRLSTRSVALVMPSPRRLARVPSGTVT